MLKAADADTWNETEAPPRVRERLNDRPRLILQEAQSIVGQRGYFGFSIKELAARCGISVPGVLHHFPSKTAILVALLRDRDRREEQALLAMLPAGWTLGDYLSPDQVERLFHDIAELNSRQRELVRLYSMLRTEALYEAHPAHSFFIKRDVRVIRIFEQILTPHVADPKVTARRIFAIMGGLEELWLRDLEAFDLVVECDAAVKLLLSQAPQAAA